MYVAARTSAAGTHAKAVRDEEKWPPLQPQPASQGFCTCYYSLAVFFPFACAK